MDSVMFEVVKEFRGEDLGSRAVNECRAAIQRVETEDFNYLREVERAGEFWTLLQNQQ